MGDTSNIVNIVDASAAVAAAYVDGLKVAWGIGGGAVSIPTDGNPITGAGGPVRAFEGNVYEPFSHVSDMPDAPKITDYSADVTEINWRVPMRVYVDRNEGAHARQSAAPFYSRYLVAFAKHSQLLGTCNSSEIASFDLFTDKDNEGFVGIAIVLSVWERLDIGFEP